MIRDDIDGTNHRPELMEPTYFFKVDGEFTLNENVCDVDGMNVAASAFSDLREAAANDLVHLPNNPYTPQQLFFINTAQVNDNLIYLLLKLLKMGELCYALGSNWQLIVIIIGYL